MKMLVLPMVVAVFLGCAASPPAAEVSAAKLALASAEVLPANVAPNGTVADDDVATPPAAVPVVSAAAFVPEVSAPKEKRGVPPRLSHADVQKGEAAWKKEGCSSCHHVGTADAPKKRPMAVIHNPLESDEQVRNAENAVRTGFDGRLSMPAHPHLDEPTLLNLLAYARSLQ